MNAEYLLKELELAAWEQSEAETHERAAKKLRMDATRRMAVCHIEIKLALEKAKDMKQSKPQ